MSLREEVQSKWQPACGDFYKIIYLLTGMHHLHIHHRGDLCQRKETPYDG